ncbi:MAG TPA: zinc-binding alcohol dehydrogenase family protein [Tepidisphaeraceae bacterium]|jgi:alcohol dehydrogenase|nr:zinc-binding alcohol dehydrogenase family protein [Tepidisphaeraceae bacterium]
MKAIQLKEPGHFARIDVAEPSAPAAGQALVRVHRVGICGTDISGFLGKMPFFSYPRIPGHELGVEVLAVGSGVTNVKPGDRCSVEPYMNCGDCHACRKGASNCCANLKVLGVMTDGGLCERFVLPAHKLHPSTELSFEQLALVETLAIGCHAVDRSALVKSEDCLIIGAGPIGLSAIVFAKLTGARIIVLDMNRQRLDFCKEVMGVDETIVLGDGVEKEIRAITNGDNPDVVIDATGSNVSMSNAFGYVAPTGRLVYVGITTKEVTFKHPVFHRPEGTLLCSRNALPRDFARIIRLIEEGKINTKPWVTHRTAFDSLIAYFPSFTRPETGVIKAVVEMEGE